MFTRAAHRLALGGAFVLWSAAAGSARAQAIEEPIEVTVRGASTGAYASQATEGASTREAADAASLVGELPGVHVRRLGADGSYATLSIRGSASTQVGVVLGGIPLTSAADPSLDVGSLPLWPGASLRAYRGFAPASLGTTGYLGGVLSIDPPAPSLGDATEVWLLGGSFGTLKLRAGDRRRTGPWTLGTAIFASRTDGDFTYPLDDPRGGAPTERRRTNARVVSVGGIERATLSRSWGTLGATLFAQSRQQGLAGSVAQPTKAASLASSRLVAGVDALVRTGALGGVHSALWFRQDLSKYADPLGEIDISRPHAHDAIGAVGGSLGWRGRPRRPLLIDVVIDARSERFDPAQGGARMIQARRVAGGAGLDATWALSDAVSVGLAARVDALRDRARGPRLGGDLGSERSGVAPTGHLGLSARLAGSALIAAAHLGALERPPGFVELYGNLGQLVGDPGLLPERALSADAGVSGDLGSSRLAFGYEAVAFASSARDLIAFVPLGLGTLRARNIDSATIAGVEVSVRLRASALEQRVAYTLMSATNTSSDPLERGRPLPGRPAHDLRYDATYRLGPLRARYGLDVVGGSTIDARGAIVLPTRALHGLGLSVRPPLSPMLEVGLQVDNLFDLRALHPVAASPLAKRAVAVPVSDLLGYPLPGRSVFMTIRVRPGSVD